MGVKKYLGQILTSMGFVTGEQLSEALIKQNEILRDKMLPEQLQRASLISAARSFSTSEQIPFLGQILIDLGFVTNEQISIALKEQGSSTHIYNKLDHKKLAEALEIGFHINSSLKITQVLNLIMNNANRVTNSTASTLMLLDEDTGELVFSIPTGPKKEKLIDIRIPKGKGIAGWVAENRQSVLVKDVGNDHRFYNKIDKISGIETESLLCVPLMSKTKLIGIIEVINKADGTHFTEEDELLLNILGHQASIAIENARLYGELKDSLDKLNATKEDLQRSNQALKALSQCNQALLHTATEDDLLQKIAKIIVKTGEYRLAWIGYAEQDSSKIVRTVAMAGETVEDINDLSVSWNEVEKGLSPLGKAISTGKQSIARNILGDPDFLPLRESAIKYGFASSISLPLFVNNRVLGCINIYSIEPDAFDIEEVLLLTELAENLAFGIQTLRANQERELLQKRILRSEKMEAIGTLAGGIAHDFNNILAAIVGYTELSQMNVPEENRASAYLVEINKATNRAKDLVQQILTFSRQVDQELRPTQPNIIIKEALKLLRATLPSTIEIRKNIKSNSPIMGDATQIHQIIMNLCTNAAYAMRERGGILEVSLEDIEIGPDLTEKHRELVPGPGLKLTVSDNGCGIPPVELNKIFDPFYTTKGQGEGTGMGLAVVHGIIKNHRGVIDIYSETGKGSKFEIYLLAIHRGVEKSYKKKKNLPSGSEHIFLIDDENTLADMGKDLLESLGYRVTTRTNSYYALELFKKRSESFDLIITDMTMPNMTGDEIAKKMLEIRRDIPVILYTGFNNRISEEKALSIGISAFVMKPIILEDLAQTIRKVLDKNH